MSSTSLDNFVYSLDMSADEIPVEQVGTEELGIAPQTRPAEYTRVPSAAYHFFSPSSRLVLSLLFAHRVFGEDAAGGWIKLGRGLYERFELGDRDLRRRAVAALEREGVAEVRRRPGRPTLLRLKMGERVGANTNNIGNSVTVSNLKVS